MPTATRIRDHCLAPPGRTVDAPTPGGGYRRLFPELDPLDCEDDAAGAAIPVRDRHTVSDVVGNCLPFAHDIRAVTAVRTRDNAVRSAKGLRHERRPGRDRHRCR
jgi:hypothetical protein